MAEQTKAVAKRTAEGELTDRLGLRFGLSGEVVKGVISRVLGIAKKGNEAVSTTELVGFMIVCDQHNLNPFTKQIYAFVGKGGQVSPLVGIDGWIAIVNRQKMYDGCNFKFTDNESDELKPIDCTCTMYLKNRSQPVIVTERFRECYRNTDPWNTMPYRMMRHKAFIQTARVAFGLSGIYDEDETRDIVGEGTIVDMGQAEVIGSRPLQEPKDDPFAPGAHKPSKPEEKPQNDAQEPIEGVDGTPTPEKPSNEPEPATEPAEQGEEPARKSTPRGRKRELMQLLGMDLTTHKIWELGQLKTLWAAKQVKEEEAEKAEDGIIPDDQLFSGKPEEAAIPSADQMRQDILKHPNIKLNPEANLVALMLTIESLKHYEIPAIAKHIVEGKLAVDAFILDAISGALDK